MIRSLSPEDFGGEDIMSNINEESAATFQTTLELTGTTISQLCYCEKPLLRHTQSRPFGAYQCLSCFEVSSRRVTFKCYNDDCIFKRRTPFTYRICSTCYEWTGDGKFDCDAKEDEFENSYVFRRTNCSIKMISSVLSVTAN